MNNKELIDFANWLWDMNYLNINSQLPPFKNAETLANHYSKVKKLNIPIVSGLLLLDEQNLNDEIEQAYKRYGHDNKDHIDAYIEGLKDGAKYYNVSEQ